jgi:hypothetical protein
VPSPSDRVEFRRGGSVFDRTHYCPATGRHNTRAASVRSGCLSATECPTAIGELLSPVKGVNAVGVVVDHRRRSHSGLGACGQPAGCPSPAPAGRHVPSSPQLIGHWERVPFIGSGQRDDDTHPMAVSVNGQPTFTQPCGHYPSPGFAGVVRPARVAGWSTFPSLAGRVTWPRLGGDVRQGAHHRTLPATGRGRGWVTSEVRNINPARLERSERGRNALPFAGRSCLPGGAP